MAKRLLYKPVPSSASNDPQHISSPKSLAQGLLADSSWQEELARSSASVQPIIRANTSNEYTRQSLQLVNEERIFRTPEKKSESHERVNQSSAKKSLLLENPASRTSSNKNDGTTQNRFAVPNEVVLIDASGPALNPELSEVSTVSHKIFSPAKVICHSPSPEKSPKHRDTIEQNVKVTVISPKEIIFTHGETSIKDNEENENQNSKERLSPVNRISQERVIKKKKRAPRIVQSRYKNVKEQRPSKSSEVEAQNSRPLGHSFSSDISGIASNPVGEGQISGQLRKMKKAKVTSTPFNQAGWNEKTRHYVTDGSYLDISKNLTIGHQDVAHTIAKKPKVLKEKSSVQTLDKGKSSGVDSGIIPGTQSFSESVTEHQLEMEYCRMLQAMYLHAKAKDTFNKQEKEAKAQIYKVWQENQRLKSEVRELEQAVQTKKHTMVMDQVLKAQDSGLKKVDDSLDKLHNSYLTLSDSLDSTRHFLPVEDIWIQDEEKLISALKESQMILAEISAYTGTKENDMNKLVTDMKVLVDKLRSEVSEQDKCQEMLMAAKSLTNQERSLQSQILESGTRKLHPL